ncbi:hypothetical protein A2867_01890 [Candidatus Daviesbacteria bacterium RIFCSPHIGHO2_01_FULL_40_11]|uniref:Uncharacterized protein n=1 Tax=Candidatus Daviesbacteria bacterium RIFCSPHIGHO2_01_FULL_40_11 TaxID=1797762 RepID=A0A1F5JH00_9BACT|nr:MAG: hypothetical protein A2867_01890 [Candidatus Daviesbacteria bacterium RIFCSPHIGHO2_01_FULL_40_11]
MALENNLNLPIEVKAKIFTSETDDWLPYVARAIVEDKKSCLVQGGDAGMYVIIGGVFAGERDSSVLRLINRQKGRDEAESIAIMVPQPEMPSLAAESYRDRIRKVVTALDNEYFGLIVPASEGIPDWLSSYDRLHRVREKLVLWGDKGGDCPVAKLYPYIRNKYRLQTEDFFIIGTSANLHKEKANSYFNPAYEQLGDKEGLAYAVMDPDEDKYSKGSVTILSALPLTRGRDRILVVRESRSADEMIAKAPQISRMTQLGWLRYSLSVKAQLGRESLIGRIRGYNIGNAA